MPSRVDIGVLLPLLRSRWLLHYRLNQIVNTNINGSTPPPPGPRQASVRYVMFSVTQVTQTRHEDDDDAAVHGVVNPPPTPQRSTPRGDIRDTTAPQHHAATVVRWLARGGCVLAVATRPTPSRWPRRPLVSQPQPHDHLLLGWGGVERSRGGGGGGTLKRHGGSGCNCGPRPSTQRRKVRIDAKMNCTRDCFLLLESS